MSVNQRPTLHIVIADESRHAHHLVEVVVDFDHARLKRSVRVSFVEVETTYKVLARKIAIGQDPPDLRDLLGTRKSRVRHIREVVQVPDTIEKREARFDLQDRRTKVPRSSEDFIVLPLEVVEERAIAPPLLPDHNFVGSWTREIGSPLSGVTLLLGRAEISEDRPKGVIIVVPHHILRLTVERNVAGRRLLPVIVERDRDITHLPDRKLGLRCPEHKGTPRLPSGRGMSKTSLLTMSTLIERFDKFSLTYVPITRCRPRMMSIEGAKYRWALVLWLY